MMNNRHRVGFYLVQIFTVAVCHVLLFIYLYRSRVLAIESGKTSSDLSLFVAPAAIAFAAYVYLTNRALFIESRGFKKTIGVWAISFFEMLISSWAGIVIAFNRFGT